MKNFLYYNKQERRGIFVLMFLIVLFALIPFFFPKKPSTSPTNYEARMEQLLAEKDSLLMVEKWQKKKPWQNQPAVDNKREKSFTPQPSSQVSKSYPSQKKKKEETTPAEKPKPVIIDINQATAAEFAQLKGIGEVLSNRIVKFRNGLGGFYSIEQMGSTYGIEPSVFAEIKPQLTISGGVKQLDINQATVAQLSAHPYISEKLANQIVNYRSKVSPFSSDADIKKLYLMNDDLFSKLKPYLRISE